MKGHVFYCTGPGVVDQFTTSVKAMTDLIGLTFTEGADMQKEIRTMTEFNFKKERPKKPGADADEADKEDYNKDLKAHGKRRRQRIMVKEKR